MKKLILAITSALLAVSLCGCQFLEDINSKIQDITNTSPDGFYVIETENVEVINVNPGVIDDDNLEYLYCYKMLNQEQKRLYLTIHTAVSTMQTGWINLGKCSKNFGADIAVAYQALSNDHPEFFWMPYTYLLSNSGSGNSPKVAIALSCHEDGYSYDYLIKPSQKEGMEKELDAKVEEIIAKVKGMTVYRTELYLHDLICTETEYTLGEPEELVFTAYGALVNGKSVCEGYSRAMQLICKRLGIPCALVTGIADGQGHMWNIIDPGDGWYHLDLTWDDGSPDNTPLYSYFNLTDKEIGRTHTESKHFASLSSDTILSDRNFNILNEKCEKTSYNYFVHNGLEFGENYAKSVAESVVLAFEEGETSLQFRFTDEKLAADFSDGYQKYVSEIQKRIDDILTHKAPRISNISISDIYVTLFWE